MLDWHPAQEIICCCWIGIQLRRSSFNVGLASSSGDHLLLFDWYPAQEIIVCGWIDIQLRRSSSDAGSISSSGDHPLLLV